ncbi:MAG: murein biosynthesis integral membrane protein MurJ [Phycisphaerae bacterium]|nr:murein biosynthesis integral membrane protein MurJ [Phycisphaerae bacterium]
MTELSQPELNLPARRALPWRCLFLGYLVLLTIGTHLPNPELGPPGGPVLPDKLFHLFAFMGLTLLLWRSRLLPLTWLVPTVIAIWVPIDEWTQGLTSPSRTVAMSDLIAGWMGVVMAGCTILALSPIGPNPYRAGRRRFLYLLDRSIMDIRKSWLMIASPFLVVFLGFFVPWMICVGLDYDCWITDHSDIFFILIMIATAGISAWLLSIRLRTVGGNLLEDKPCFECGTSLCIDDEINGDITCPSCSTVANGTQWQALRVPQTKRPAMSILSVLAFGILMAIITAIVLIELMSGFIQESSPEWDGMLAVMIVGSVIFSICIAWLLRGFQSGRIVERLGWACANCGHDLRATAVDSGIRTCNECGALSQNWARAHVGSPRGFEQNARTVMSMTALSRLTGLGREAVLSRFFGTDAILSTYFFAFMIPNLFRRLFGEGALAAAFLPNYEKLTREDPQMAGKLATATLGVVAIGLGLFVLIAELVLLGISFFVGDGNTAIYLVMIMLPYAPLVCLVAILGAMLQVHGRFGPTSAAPIILNMFITIAAVVGFGLMEKMSTNQFLVVCLMSFAVVIAGLVQLIWSWAALRPHASLPLRIAGVRSHVTDMFRRAGPMILGLGVLQVNTLIDGLIASYRNYMGTSNFLGYTWPLDESAMAVLTFAQRLYQFPLGVFGIAVATAIYPMLAKLADDKPAFTDIVHRGLRLVFFIGLPASLGLIVVARPLTGSLLQGAAFDNADTNRVAFVLLGYASCVWAYSMIQVITRAFYARNDTVTPVKIALYVVGLNLVLNLVLIWTPLKEAGLAWSTAICATLQVMLLLWHLRRHVDSPIGVATLPSMLKTCILSIVMIVVLGALMLTLPSGKSWLQQVQSLAVLVAAGSIIFAGGAAMLRMPELKWAVGGRT